MNPILFTIGPFEIRYYGILFALAFFIGYFILRKLGRGAKISEDLIDTYFIYIFLGIVIGARLGEAIFYDPAYYFSNPIEILKTWHGGLSSHGAFIGGILATMLFCRKYKVSFYRIADIIVIPVALGSVFIRLGNFINSEIVGRVTDVPWAMEFRGYEGLRHPVQIYEAIMNFAVFCSLFAIRRIRKIPEGFVFWSFVFIYSFLRFFIEFFKEYETLGPEYVLTIGQYLCIAFLAVSAYAIARKYRRFVINLISS
ncbi:prolipoprotein diacylglyceryl transferase [Candidatus Woesearchaeota archaeon CG10_big_fil_rev_8_21_14_0_10_44_13]|nr:MAG: prolipoprotein diacylglyceryl transferase [Candidatus Woesearchaeota archaeon CG10_big_fil_rev_8_21_14_0_10_44_13]